ncbi:hypothetical protein [Anaplasma phagocytophilum]|uniref:Uncharacterized protein n=1 Tax=Anaplasma phagocytophilum TaxID=948 RepID=A0A098GMF8_ANAPH|nr:hypothetical protein [Anaplasma phagocytophilum]CEH11212.1 Uncharacterized protein ANAPHAGO_00409 [Anaplasma phagocytophilum]
MEAIKALQSQSITILIEQYAAIVVLDGDQSFLDAKIKALLRGGDKVINAVLSFQGCYK